MSTIYLDESGDLGFNFNKNSSKYFVIALFETNLSQKELKKLIRVSKERTIKNTKNRKFEIKGSCKNTSHETKIFLLNKLLEKESNFKINAIIINKENIYDNLRDKSRVFYNYISKEVLKENSNKRIKLILDKKDRKERFTQEMNKYLIDTFNSIELDLNHEYSHCYAGLQIVDVIANSIFRKFERDESELYNIFKKNLNLKKYYF
jgi:hypothetical protein